MEVYEPEKEKIRTLFLFRAHERRRLRTINCHLCEVPSFHRLPMLENIKHQAQHYLHPLMNYKQIQRVTMLNENVQRKLLKVTNSGKNVLPVIDCENIPLEKTKVKIGERCVLLTNRNGPRERD